MKSLHATELSSEFPHNETTGPGVLAQFERLETWLIAEALPFQQTHARAQAGFHERTDTHGVPVDMPRRARSGLEGHRHPAQAGGGRGRDQRGHLDLSGEVIVGAGLRGAAAFGVNDHAVLLCRRMWRGGRGSARGSVTEHQRAAPDRGWASQPRRDHFISQV